MTEQLRCLIKTQLGNGGTVHLTLVAKEELGDKRESAMETMRMCREGGGECARWMKEALVLCQRSVSVPVKVRRCEGHRGRDDEEKQEGESLGAGVGTGQRGESVVFGMFKNNKKKLRRGLMGG